MKVLVRLAEDRLLLVLALLLQGVFMSQFITRTTARVHVSETELQRSLARYRMLLQHDDSGVDLLQSETLEISWPKQEEQKEIKTNIDDALENPEKKVDEFQAAFELGGEKDDTITIMQSNEKVTSETTKEQLGDELLPQSPEEEQDSLLKTEEQNLSLENQVEVIQQLVVEEVKSEEKTQEEEPTVDNLGESAADEGEHSAHIEEQQDQGEEQKQKQKQVEAESNADNQQQGEITEEPKSNDQILEHNEVREQYEAKSNEQQTEDNLEVVSKAEENKSAEWKESETKTDEKTIEEKRESESNSEEQEIDEVREEQSTESKTEQTSPAEEEPFVFPEPYLLGPTIKDWDEQRGNWLNSKPNLRTTSDGKPRVLIVTGSQPNPCHSQVGDSINLKSFKLKIDYARMHNYEIYYNFAWLDPLFGSYWVKLPIVRKLMLTHPEIEWFFWIDSDAVFTDMIFEAPFDTYDSEGINMIMWGYPEGFYVHKSWYAFNAGVFMIRNCQWSLDLIDKWSPMGPEGPVRDAYGKILTSYLSNRDQNYPADDQSALAYLILTDEAVKSKVKLVDLNDYMVSAWWVDVVDTYETSMEKYHPGLGDWRWPWITHFTGCSPCNGDGSSPDYLKCLKHIERALNFADNQVLAYMGYQHESLSSNSLIRIRNESDRPLEFVGVNPWEERIGQVAAAAA